jgi:hypothetical protein
MHFSLYKKRRNLFKVAKVMLSSKTLEIIKCVNIIKCVTVVSLWQESGFAASLEQSGHQLGDIEVAIVIKIGQESLEKLFTKRVSYLKKKIVSSDNIFEKFVLILKMFSQVEQRKLRVPKVAGRGRKQNPTRQTDRELVCLWFENLICKWYAVRSLYWSNSDQKRPYSPIKQNF